MIPSPSLGRESSSIHINHDILLNQSQDQGFVIGYSYLTLDLYLYIPWVLLDHADVISFIYVESVSGLINMNFKRVKRSTFDTKLQGGRELCGTELLMLGRVIVVKRTCRASLSAILTHPCTIVLSIISIILLIPT